MNLMKAVRRCVSAVLIVFVLLTNWGPALAQSADVQFFPETGHNIKGDFLKFYNNAKDPQLVYGYPITEQITSKDGRTVQYFQRGRFELSADLPERVQLTPVGQAAYTTGSQQFTVNNSQGCELFSSGFRVCFAFLDFYKLNDGPTQFGNPISPFEFRETVAAKVQPVLQRMVQVMIDWRP